MMQYSLFMQQATLSMSITGSITFFYFYDMTQLKFRFHFIINESDV